METILTKRIKMLTHSFKPKMSAGEVGRTIRYADEVWTPNGIVDSIRFEDYISSCFEDCKIINHIAYFDKSNVDKLSNDSLVKHAYLEGKNLGQCKINGLDFPNKNCNGCFYKVKNVKEIDMLITAYEVKITKSDFLSKNGHNIDDINNPIGNENYYCVPKELVKDIVDYVPEHVGIIEYYIGKKQDGLRIVKQAKYINVPEKTKVLLLYNAMKKWCDKAVFPKEKD